MPRMPLEEELSEADEHSSEEEKQILARSYEKFHQTFSPKYEKKDPTTTDDRTDLSEIYQPKPTNEYHLPD